MSPADRKLLRPCDAAGLILLRRASGGEMSVLLGRRHGKAGFMPGVFVPPGGRLDPGDSLPSGFREEVLAQALSGVDQASRRRLPAFKRCALRETWEETGLLVGRPAPPAPSGDDFSAPKDLREPWASFKKAGIVPALEDLRLVARAITPRGSPRRFHTRFFLSIDPEVRGGISGDGELEEIAWVPLAALPGLPMPGVTAAVLEEALRQAAALERREEPTPVRFFYRRDGDSAIRRLRT